MCRLPIAEWTNGLEQGLSTCEVVFMSKHTSRIGPMNEDDCRRKCSGDCKCLGYFYNKDTSKCWIAYDLHTLTRVGNSTHVGYIKALK
ncbi:hypothetical protein Peur_056244 [Populus x canadensis]